MELFTAAERPKRILVSKCTFTDRSHTFSRIKIETVLVACTGVAGTKVVVVNGTRGKWLLRGARHSCEVRAGGGSGKHASMRVKR